MTEGIGAGLRLLLVDDDPAVARAARERSTADGFELFTAGGVCEVVGRMATERFDLYVLDEVLPDGSGLDLAQAILERHDDCEVLLVTGSANLQSAVRALRLRVADYLVKPFGSPDEPAGRIASSVARLKQRRRQRAALELLEEKVTRLESVAVRDPLTGLYNHAFFQEGLAREISRSKRYRHTLGLMFIDVDNFKRINDTLGHLAGDRVLKHIANLLQGESRESDYHFRLREHDLAARYGGDEFVLLLPQTPKTGAAVTAERFRICVEDSDFGPEATLSIGVAAFPDDGDDRDGLIAAADLALYAAKKSGRNRVVTYSETLGRSGQSGAWESQIDVQRLAALQRAIAFRSIGFVYQPIFEVDDGRVIGFEALCRPDDEALPSADVLIATAEQAGRTKELGRLLRELAVEPIDRLAADVSLFVSLHPHELFDPRLLEVDAALRPWGERIVFELSRCAEIENQDRLIQALSVLRAGRFRIALAGLQAGYAGLETVVALEPDFVKLPMARLRARLRDRRSARVVRHLLDHCAEEGIRAVAEQIESEADRQVAVQLGCSLLQGRLLGEELLGEEVFCDPGPTG